MTFRSIKNQPSGISVRTSAPMSLYELSPKHSFPSFLCSFGAGADSTPEGSLFWHGHLLRFLFPSPFLTDYALQPEIQNIHLNPVCCQDSGLNVKLQQPLLCGREAARTETQVCGPVSSLPIRPAFTISPTMTRTCRLADMGMSLEKTTTTTTISQLPIKKTMTF